MLCSRLDAYNVNYSYESLRTVDVSRDPVRAAKVLGGAWVRVAAAI